MQRPTPRPRRTGRSNQIPDRRHVPQPSSESSVVRLMKKSGFFPYQRRSRDPVRYLVDSGDQDEGTGLLIQFGTKDCLGWVTVKAERSGVMP